MNQSRKRLTKTIGIGTLAVLLTAVVIHQAIPHAHGSSIPVPARTEFGFGPRASVAGRYTATLAPQSQLKVGKLLVVRVMLTDSAGQSVHGAMIRVDGGMPQHGHGLPTQPRATAMAESGMYQIDGVKFNMGGWWVFTLHVDAAAGRDSVTFNLDL